MEAVLANSKQLQEYIKAEFDRGFMEREGRVVPGEEVTSGQAVKVDATFLYADLAGSSDLAKNCPWATTASLIRAFLECSTRLIRYHGGEIRSFDGDRVMGVFMGDTKNTNAVKCARQVFHAVEFLVGPTATAHYQSVRNGGIKLKAGIGVDTGTAYAVKAGIRANNDLIWIGEPPSFAAKLSDIRDYPFSVYVTDQVYQLMNDTAKVTDGYNRWVETTTTFAGQARKVYKTSYTLRP
ncbi:MAG: adenylate/guanylate cyclase domain-containing protein [Allorhizobium sp.]|uniref:adenylate/guanylate cyclase domain-containing protein n=1 Tax=Allorhizobium sp. TaxID=633478 RepID=UPI0040342D75